MELFKSMQCKEMQFAAFRSNAAGESGTLTLSAKHCGTESSSCHSGSSDAGV